MTDQIQGDRNHAARPVRGLHRCKNWPEARELLRALERSGFIFRGHCATGWHLRPTLERRQPDPMWRSWDEARVFSKFTRLAWSLLPPNLPIDRAPVLTWLSLLQHYGGPTRLLDFTESGYVAAFFALEPIDEKDHERDREIFAVNSSAVARHAEETLATLVGDTEAQILLRNHKEPLLRKLLPDGSMGRALNVDAVFQTTPLNYDLRQSAQQSVFLFPGNLHTGTMRLLASVPDTSDMAPAVHRLVLPWQLRFDALRDLASMNVTAASLFPGLDGVARSMNQILSGSLARDEGVWTDAILNLAKPQETEPWDFEGPHDVPL